MKKKLSPMLALLLVIGAIFFGVPGGEEAIPEALPQETDAEQKSSRPRRRSNHHRRRKPKTPGETT